MAEIRPPDAPPLYIPRISAMPCIMSILKIMGITRTIAVAALSPGRAPNIIPSSPPKAITSKIDGSRTVWMPFKIKSIIYSP
jgi:hypothetical protein